MNQRITYRTFDDEDPATLEPRTIPEWMKVSFIWQSYGYANNYLTGVQFARGDFDFNSTTILTYEDA